MTMRSSGWGLCQVESLVMCITHIRNIILGGVKARRAYITIYLEGHSREKRPL